MTKLSLNSLIKSLNFNYVNDNITEANFPDNGERGKDFKIYEFKRVISSNDAIAKMKKDGYRPATLYEFLEWAKEDWNGKDLVVALGSAWRYPSGHVYVPYLRDWSGERHLYLSWRARGWGGGVILCAIRRR